MSTFLSRRIVCAGTASAVTAWQHHNQHQNEEDTCSFETASIHNSPPSAVKSLPTATRKPSFRPTCAWKEKLIPTGLDSQPWLGTALSLNKSSLSLVNGTVTSCEAAPVVEAHSSDALALHSEVIPDWKKQLLPPSLHASPFIERIEVFTEKKKDRSAHTTELYLLGTVHHSQKSAENAKHLLEAVDPDLMFVELCDERSDIFHISTDALKNHQFPWFSVLQEAFHSGLSVRHSLSFIGMNVAQHWIAKHGSGPGGDFRPAYEYLQASDRDCVLVLGDRPHSLTMGRLADLDNLAIDATHLLTEVYGSEPPKPIPDLEELEAKATVVYDKAWEEQKTWADFIMRGIVDNEYCIALSIFTSEWADMQYPPGTEMRIILQERDIYMTCKLIQLCQSGKFDRIVVLVGAGHLRGMTHLLNAGIIGTASRDPEEVLTHLIASEKYPKDDPDLQSLLTEFTAFLPK